MMKRKLIISGGEKFPDLDTSKFEAFKYIIGKMPHISFLNRAEENG